MINLPIDGFSSLVQPYFEGGDTYKNHQKYSLTHRYQTTPENSLVQGWMDFIVTINGNDKTVVECNDLDIDVSDYDRFRIFAMLPECVHLKFYCNGKLEIDQKGGYRGFYDGTKKTDIKCVNSVRYELTNHSQDGKQISLYYLGMLRDKTLKNPYTSEWEGCFSDTPDMGMFNECFMSRKELEQFKEKIKTEPFRSCYETIKKIALEAMEQVPEEQIARTLRPFFHTDFRIKETAELALVGQVEQNMDMLKMACRNALSIACCEYWCMDPMETAPTVTWHHRSFDEQYMLADISTVISMAGGLLTWHGRNILYNAMITKGLPRIEADFMTMDYIYHCNQGLFFMTGYIQGLTTLAEVYPRYQRRIEEAKELLDEMLEKAIGKDGSYHEGPMYWLCTLKKYLISAYFFAKHEKKSMREFCGDKLNATANYGLSVLDENGYILTFSDARYQKRCSYTVSAMLYAATGDNRWAEVIQKSTYDDIFDAVIAVSIALPEERAVSHLSEFLYSEPIGYTRVYREGVLFAFFSGPSNDTHCHADKGSFIIHKDGEIICPDCVDDYSNAEAMNLFRSISHSLTLPVIDGVIIEQEKGDKYASIIEVMEYKDGKLNIVCDNSHIWKTDEVVMNKRRIVSETPDEFVITDTFVFKTPAQIEFRLNVADEKRVTLIPLNWEPAERSCVPLYHWGEVNADQIRLRSEKGTQLTIETKLIVQ